MDLRRKLLSCLFLTVLWTCTSGAQLCPFSNGTIDLCCAGLTSLTAETFTSLYNCTPHFGSTTTLDLSRNNITDIRITFADFYALKTLDLSHNSISSVQNDTFKSLGSVLEYLYLGYNSFTTLTAGPYRLYSLKEIHFEHNNISYVQPGVVNYINENLVYFNLQYNSLTTFDPWPYVGPYTARDDISRIYDLQNNLITRLSNDMKWVYNLSVPFETVVLLQYNQITSLPIQDLSQYKGDLDRSTALSFFLTFHSNVTNNPYFCDCNLFYLADNLRKSIYRWHRVDEHRYICEAPQKYTGIDWLHDLPLYNFICNRTDNCPENCVCQDRPHNDTFYIDCRGAGLTKFPDVIPDTERTKIEMFLDDNDIQSVKETDYLPRLCSLSLANNKLTSLNGSLLDLMVNLSFMDLRNNQIRTLPFSVQRFNFEEVKVTGNPLFCDCDALWLIEKVTIDETRDSQTLTCNSDTGMHRIKGLKHEDLECTKVDFIIIWVFAGAAVIALAVISLFVYRCPYDTKVILHKIFRLHPWDRYAPDDDETKIVDIYLVFDEDPDVIGWVKKFLLTLQKKKPYYKILNPYRFTESGTQEEQIRKWIGKAKRILVILSEGIFENDWRMNEIDIAEDNIINAMKQNDDDDTNRAENGEAFDNITNAGRIIYIKLDKLIEEKLKEDPWRNRLLDKTVLTNGERLFMSKLRYELPLHGNGKSTKDTEENFTVVRERDDIKRLRRENQERLRQRDIAMDIIDLEMEEFANGYQTKA